MGQMLGRMLTCDRCGATVFEPWHNPWLDAKGNERVYEYRHHIYFEQTDGWISQSSFDVDKKPYNNSVKTLCPDCEAKRKDVMKQFWNNE